MNEQRAALVVHTFDENVLICHPLGFKRKPGQYDLPKGHAESSESLKATAVRECGEETGLLFNESDLSDHFIKFSYAGDELTVFFLKTPVNIVEDKLRCLSKITDDCLQKWKVGLPEIDGYRLVNYHNLSDWLFSTYSDDFFDFVESFFSRDLDE